MFFSTEQIEQSVKRLNNLNPFFGTVFLVFKQIDLPIEKTISLPFIPILDDFLQKYYRPTDKYIGFYTPFKTSNPKKRWNTHQYANSLHRVAVDTFSDVIIHPKGSSEWGWKSDYIEILWKEHLLYTPIPTFDLAVWLYRSKQWTASTQISDVLKSFFYDFGIEDTERELFNTVSLPATTLFSEKAVDTDTLLNIIGLPPEPSKSQEKRPSNAALFVRAEDGTKLQYLKLTGVGPSEEMELYLAPRLNLITGDNALGKTFLLECSWWALTGTWASQYPAYPQQNVPKDKPTISYQIGKESLPDAVQVAKYNWREQSWSEQRNRNVLPGLAVFFQADGSGAIWDPTYPTTQLSLFGEVITAEAFLHLSPSEIWIGKRGQRENKDIMLCRGLIEDWITWQSTPGDKRYQAFLTALQALSPHSKYQLIPGEPTKLPGDARRMPTLEFPYGTVPVVHCSAGIKRIIALAYLLVWAWNEHLDHTNSIREEPQRSIVLLVDEMEAHLHPLWQRVIVPALLKVVKALSGEVETQILIATHSPLILASIEPDFDQDTDSLFHLELNIENGEVHLDEVPFIKMGSVDNWLVSDIFGLEQPRSVEAEEAIAAANAIQLEKNPPRKKVQEISDILVKVLAQNDEFWPTWVYFAEKNGARLDARRNAS